MRILLSILFCWISNFIQAQDPVHRVFNNLNGLPSNSVYNILQDKKGFIWLSHDKGLSRYDGKQIDNYKNPSAQSKSLSNLIEIDDLIWCQDFTGIYYKTNQKKELIATGFYTPGPFSSGGLVNKKIVSIMFDSLRTLDLSNNKTKNYELKKTNYSGVFFNNEAVYYIEDNVLIYYNGNSFKKLFSIPKTKSYFNFLIKSGNNFYAITKNTFPYIHYLTNSNIKALPLLTQGYFIQNVCLVNNEIWICTSSGAYCFNENFTPKYGGKCFFKSNSISKVIYDREGVYWFSTLNNGILVVPNINAILFNYNNEGFTSITNKKKDILIGTTTNTIISFSNQNNSFNKLFKHLNNHEVLNIVYNEELDKTIVSNNQLTILKNKTSIKNLSGASKSVTKINNDIYAVAFASGLGLININNPILLSQIPNWLKFNKCFINNGIYNLEINTGRCRDVLYHASSQTLYAATANGLLYFSPNGNGEIKLKNKSIYASHLTIYGNDIFVGTFVQNIIKIDAKKQAIQLNVTQSAIYKIYAFDNNLFLITDDGLIQYNIATTTKQHFTSANGLPKAELKDILIKDNIIYLATSLGLVTLNINDKKINNIPPLMQLNEVFVNGSDSIFKQGISLAHNLNNIVVNFSALAYKTTDNLKLQYNINDNQWINLEDNSRILNLSSLSPNNYNIKIRAFNEDGIESKVSLNISFTIKNPFYKQWWFYVCSFLLFALILLLSFKKRLKNQQAKNNLLAQKIQLEKELQQSMMASIKSQMNPHFLFNALNTIQSYIYTNEKENASNYLGKFSELTRMILEMSNKPSVTVATEIKALQLYLELEKQRFEEKLSCSFEIEKAINQETSYIPSMLVQPYVENAIKHGLLHSKRNWILQLQFKKSLNGLQVVIDDNGIGRKRSFELNKQKASKHQSFSTNANKKRLEILNQGFNNNITVEIIDKEDEFGNALGTSIILNIPFVSSTI